MRRLGISAVGLALLGGCGPSIEIQHENNLRFEHCYRLDADPKITASHRGHCWREWTASHSSGQPLDRIEYARRRIADLESGTATTVTIHPVRGPVTRVFEELPQTGPMAAPAPTSAHAPPPRTEPVPVTPPVDAGADPRPGSACAAACSGDLEKCDALCTNKHADCGACREDYRRCMRRCFQ